ncbi:MAG: cysteine desulfurase family protein [Fimbriimonadales bacterium]
MDASRYFDNAATTPLDPRVREAMLPYVDDAFGNANSIHSWGLRAHDAVQRAREQVARLIGAEDPAQIYFTSGATESNNWVLNAADKIVISPFEHSSMREPALRRSARVLEIDGLSIEPPTMPNAQHPTPNALLSVMAVNNEIGTIWHAPNYALEGDFVHSDITQAVGKIPIAVDGLDFASFSAHKFYGPKGIGALYCRDRPPEPLILGGEQEQGFRGGTLNVPAIVGMGAAAEIASQEQPEDFERATLLRTILLDGLKGLTDYQINGGDRTSPFIVSVSFRGLEGETVVLELDRAGFAASAGAACSSRSTEPSHVLTALDMEPAWLRGTVRFSFGRFNTPEATAALVKTLRTSMEKLRRT